MRTNQTEPGLRPKYRSCSESQSLWGRLCARCAVASSYCEVNSYSMAFAHLHNSARHAAQHQRCKKAPSATGTGECEVSAGSVVEHGLETRSSRGIVIVCMGVCVWLRVAGRICLCVCVCVSAWQMFAQNVHVHTFMFTYIMHGTQLVLDERTGTGTRSCFDDDNASAAPSDSLISRRRVAVPIDCIATFAYLHAHKSHRNDADQRAGDSCRPTGCAGRVATTPTPSPPPCCSADFLSFSHKSIGANVLAGWILQMKNCNSSQPSTKSSRAQRKNETTSRKAIHMMHSNITTN